MIESVNLGAGKKFCGAQFFHKPPIWAIRGSDKTTAFVYVVLARTRLVPGGKINIMGFQDFFGNTGIGNDDVCGCAYT